MSVGIQTANKIITYLKGVKEALGISEEVCRSYRQVHRDETKRYLDKLPNSDDKDEKNTLYHYWNEVCQIEYDTGKDFKMDKYYALISKYGNGYKHVNKMWSQMYEINLGEEPPIQPQTTLQRLHTTPSKQITPQTINNMLQMVNTPQNERPPSYESL